MRQGQQNRRGRGRNNNNNNNNNHNNRKNQNPLTRSFESAGPDIKIRGNPSHIAEKYVSLARDALSSGDPVLAENYLQHAEHYNRIILTYREQQMSQQGGELVHGSQARTHGLHSFDGEGEDGGDDEADDMSAVAQATAMHIPGEGPQPAIGGGRDGGGSYNNHRSENNHRSDSRQQHQPRQQQQHGRGDRSNGSNGQGTDQNGNRRRDRFQDGNGNRDRQRFVDRGGEQQPTSRPPAPALADDESNEQPAFLRRPIRRPRRSTEEGGESASISPIAASDDQE